MRASLIKNARLARSLLATVAALGLAGLAHAAQPIPVAVTANAASPIGRAIFQGAQLAVDEINAAGGVDGRPIRIDKYDNHASSGDAVRGFQRATRQAHDVAVVGDYISEVALALEPWAARLKEPYIITGAASTKITDVIHAHPKRNRYIFQNTFNSVFWARSVCAYAHDILAQDLGYKSAVIVSENAAWTKPLDAEYEKCLPRAGLKVAHKILFSPDTNDFTPIFNKAESYHADVMIVGLAHTGVKPTVQWYQQQVPMLMAGMNVQAQAGGFWRATNGATNGVITVDMGATKASLTPKTQHFVQAYVQRFGENPAFDAYTSYDAIYVLKQAIERAGSTDGPALAAALAKTNYEGTIGRIAYYGLNDRYPHAMKFGPGYVTGVAVQWQHGSKEAIWPKSAASAKVILPAFVKSRASQ